MRSSPGTQDSFFKLWGPWARAHTSFLESMKTSFINWPLWLHLINWTWVQDPFGTRKGSQGRQKSIVGKNRNNGVGWIVFKSVPLFPWACSWGKSPTWTLVKWEWYLLKKIIVKVKWEIISEDLNTMLSRWLRAPWTFTMQTMVAAATTTTMTLVTRTQKSRRKQSLNSTCSLRPGWTSRICDYPETVLS